mmetsp:Transcript_9026/g.20370  ORF Transcript_9026/g.20370 Transcript_9026/m.20370 type:complete len:384 (+) Transcript_9026:70-1221(+)|eukprot:CAMPEP_0172318978 /NCGR_PEP_ID=MMETSP1058-20130122/36391_1 /TAXON_ID=83371 /ORGANISM="Detonula confervacea, Strain CCMP 353" /LENGTH=383 /DNA_ID=CAMNT_0013033911 /DNA_START=37 /DNA_END=1188 /DNA_ORIENTATION=+
MANPPSSNDDFYSKALASLSHQMTLASDNDATATNASNSAAEAIKIESYAKSLVEEDLPKIDSAVKSYLSLVAARSAVASDIDVLPDLASISSVQCTFASTAKTPMDANRCALICARTLLSTINSTNIPPESTAVEEISATKVHDETKSGEEEKIMQIQLQSNATQILWNRLVQSLSNSTGDKAKQNKPSKVLGRQSLQVAYPYVQERLRRGLLLSGDNSNTASSTADNDATKTASSQNNPLHAVSNEVLPPVNPPKGIDIEQWEAFFTEFGNLLNCACSDNWCDEKEPPQSAAPSSSKVEHDDSALLWSNDKGLAELQTRRENRAQRATKALASVDGAKAVVADALSSSASGGECRLPLEGAGVVEHWRGNVLVGSEKVTRP